MIRPLEHTGDSANIAYYRERNAQPGTDYVWCSVLHSCIGKRGGEWVRTPPVYHFTIYREGRGEVACVLYRPSRNPKGTLSERTVTAQVRAALGRAKL